MGDLETLTDELVKDIAVAYGTAYIVKEVSPILKRHQYSWRERRGVRNDVFASVSP